MSTFITSLVNANGAACISRQHWIHYLMTHILCAFGASLICSRRNNKYVNVGHRKIRSTEN